MNLLLPSHEISRLKALYQYQILDTQPERVFDDLTQLAALICQTPMAVISFVDQERQWFKSKIGLEVSETARSLSFCTHTIEQTELLIVPDSWTDVRFAENPLVQGEPHIRFYAGAPLITPQGQAVGTLCVLDQQPRSLSSEQRSALEALGRQVVSQLELRRHIEVLIETDEIRQHTEETLCKAVAENLALARAIASTSEGVVITDPNQPDNPIIYTNPAFTKLTGYSAEEAKGQNPRFLQGPATHPETVAQIHRAIAHRQEIQAVILNYHKNGDPFWNELKITPVFGEDGQLVSFVGIQSDITQRQQSELSLRESEERLRLLVESVKDYAIYMLDPQGRILSWNAGAQRIQGYRAQEVIGQLTDRFYTSEDQANGSSQQLLAQAIASGRVEDEGWRLRKDGSTFWANVVITALHDLQGQLRGFVEVTRDMSDRRRVEEALRDSEQQYRDVLDNIGEVVFQMTPQGHWTFLNQAWMRITGFSLGESIGQNICDRLHPDDHRDFEQAFQSLVQEECDHLERHWRYQIQDEQWRWLEVNAYPVRNGQGQVFSIFGTLADVTARKQAEAAMQERSQLAALSAQIGVTLGHGGTLAEILDHCTATLVEHLPGTAARIWTLEPASQFLELQAIAGQQTPTDEFPSRIPLGISIIGFIAQNQQAYISQDAPNDFCIGAKDWLVQEQIVAFAGYPLVVEERLVGVLSLFSRQPLSSTTLSTLGWVANSLAIAIDRTLAREELLSRREALLLRLANQIRNSLDLDTILGIAVTEIRSLLQIDRCYFVWCWPHPEHPTLAITHEARHPDLPEILGDVPATQAKMMGQKILDLEPIRVSDIQNELELDLDPETATFFAHADFRSYLLLPLETRSNQLGAIVCSHSQGVHIWSDSEVELLQAVTDQLAIAMDQAELYAQTRAAAFAAQAQANQISDTLHKLQETQAQLVQHEKMSSLGQLVAGVAHEINNPINFINGNLIYTNDYVRDLLKLIERYQAHYPEPAAEIQTLADEIDLEFILEDLPKMLASMQIGTDRIRQIVLSLRNFSRLDEAEMKIANLHEGIDNTLLILQHRLKATSEHPETQIIKQYGQLPKVECYPGQLNQVFMNILSNAIDALDEQPAPHIITITTGLKSQFTPPSDGEPLDLSQDAVVLRFRDNGPGMDENVRTHLFDPFFTTKPVGKGTGLGLSISYQIIVEKHHGQLKCLSEPGQGAEFWIEIPLPRSDENFLEREA